MKWILLTIAATAVISLGFISKSHKKPLSKTIKIAPGIFPPVAVLELFTSEGCSSCPPADNLLPELAKLDSNVMILSFHVDYWNRLGWEDPFSNAAYSERQRQYGSQFHLESIYTPQLVVNGEYELVGSSRKEATQTIQKALTEKAAVKIIIDKVKNDAGKLLVDCRAEGDLKRIDLVAAFVQKQAAINVKAGENRGAKLSHTNVVRAFVKQKAAASDSFTLEVPASIAGDNWQLIVYAQQRDDLKITGAVVYNPSHQ